MKKLLSITLAIVLCLSVMPFALAATVRGDANLDGSVNSIDALLILRKAVQIEDDVFNEYTYDVNGDYKINSLDALRVLMIAVKSDDPLTYNKKELLKFYSDALLSSYITTDRIDYSDCYKSVLVNDADPSQKIDFDDTYADTITFTDGYDEIGLTPADYFPIPWIHEDGVADASITKTEEGYEVKITLIEEKVTFDEPIPPYHADHACYSDCTLSGFEDAWIEDSTAVYSGATITATINNQGYVTMLSVLSPFVINMTLATEYDSETLDATETGTYGFTIFIYGLTQ